MFPGGNRQGAIAIRRVLAAAAVVAGLVSPAVLSSTSGARVLGATARARAASSGPVGVSLSIAGGSQAIPATFFGLSVEYNELPTYERSGVLFDRVVQMLRPERGAPLTLRIGGKSADHMLWEPDAAKAAKTKLAPGVFALGEGWLDNLAKLVRRDRLRVILDLNLAVHSPSMAASFAAAVRKALPAGSLVALEIGNEPDMYHYQPRLTRERVASTLRSTPRHWWNNYSNVNYRRDYLAYARALHASVPGVRLGAPDITMPRTQWLTGLSNLGKLGPGFLGIHRYGTSGCFPVGSSAYPTISNLLNNANSQGLAGTVSHWVGYAHSHHMGLRVSEINSVSCGRDRGVANAFASALWADDTLFSMVHAGVDAVSWHIRPAPLNAPFHFTKEGIAAAPELYALSAFSLMTQGPARMLDSHVSSPSGVHLRAWVVRGRHTLRVLLINKGHQTLRVLVPARGHGAAEVRWLTAPGVRATGGVRFAGQRIGSDALWHGKAVVMHERAQGGQLHVRVGPYSEAVVTL